MKTYDPSRPLVSLHIPKCAGTSFQAVLRTWFGRRLYDHYLDEKTGKPARRHRLKSRLSPTRWKHGVCVHGHFNKRRPGSALREYYPEVDQFITVLRDPFEVHLSQYFWGRRLGEYRFRDGESKPLPPTEEYDLDHYLAERRSFLLLHIPFDLTLENYKSVIEENYVYVGIAEDLQTSVDVLAGKLGFQPVKIDRMNVSKRNEDAPEQARQDFKDRHPLEYAIYEYALERYRQ